MTGAVKEKAATGPLEAGMRASAAWIVMPIAINALVVLLIFNSAGLVQWAQRLPSSEASSWIAERAADWDRLMQVPPSEVLKFIKQIAKWD